MWTLIANIAVWLFGRFFKPKSQVQVNTTLANKVTEDEANQPRGIAADISVLDKPDF